MLQFLGNTLANTDLTLAKDANKYILKEYSQDTKDVEKNIQLLEKHFYNMLSDKRRIIKQNVQWVEQLQQCIYNYI